MAVIVVAMMMVVAMGVAWVVTKEAQLTQRTQLTGI